MVNLIEVKRYYVNDYMALSVITVDGLAFFGLEPGKDKMICDGMYKLGLRKEGGKHNQYKKKFPQYHEGMIEVKDVPGKKYILWHIGNYITDTKGCLLVACGVIFPASFGRNENGMILKQSTDGYKKLYEAVIDMFSIGEVFARYTSL